MKTQQTNKNMLRHWCSPATCVIFETDQNADSVLVTQTGVIVLDTQNIQDPPLMRGLFKHVSHALLSISTILISFGYASVVFKMIISNFQGDLV